MDKFLNTPLPHAIGTENVRYLLLETGLSEWYWCVAPWAHTKRRHLSSEYVDPPLDPFKLFLVDPARITRFTGRGFYLWNSRWKDFGAVIDGDWDKREPTSLGRGATGSKSWLYLAETFTETPLHKGLVEHFVNDVPWEEIDFVTEVIDRVRSSETNVWQNCSTVTEVRQYCDDLDQLYWDMRDRGCLSMRELNAHEARSMTFQEVMENEVLVDVSRTGEPLFVTGRHRLSLAKILAFDRIPVAVVVRHPEWITRLREPGHATAGTENSGLSESGPPRGEPYDVSW